MIKKIFKIISHRYKGDSQILKIEYKKSLIKLNVNLIGKIQIKNLLMAIIAASNSNLNLKKILSVIPKIKPVKGRLEKISKIKNKSRVIISEINFIRIIIRNFSHF